MQPWRVLDPSGALYRRWGIAERRAAGVSLSRSPPEDSLGGSVIAWDVWLTKEKEGLKGVHVLSNLLLLHDPEAQSSIRASPPQKFGQLQSVRPPDP